MTHYYSPHTGEHIDTDNPAPWMLIAPVAPPSYDKAAASCFWRGQGWEVVAAIPAATHIVPISPRQIRQALTRAGLRSQVEAAVAAGNQDLKDWWEFATVFEREHPMVVDMGAALGQAPTQLDALWALGASL